MMKLIILTCEPNMKAICDWLCKHTHVILKKEIPEYNVDDYSELQAASKAVKEGEGDKKETILKILGRLPNEKKGNLKSKNENKKNKNKNTNNNKKKWVPPTSKRLDSFRTSKNMVQWILENILQDAITLLDDNFKPSRLIYPTGFKAKRFANEIGHPQHRVTAFLSSGLITLPNENEATGYHKVDAPEQSELSEDDILDFIYAQGPLREFPKMLMSIL